MRIFLLSDVHGNVTGARAVLAEIDRLGGADAVICAGDILGGGPGAGDLLDLLVEREVVLIRGNHEEMYVDDDVLVRHCDPRWVPYFRATADWLGEHLTQEHWDLLRGLPAQLLIDPIDEPRQRLCVYHATPRSTWDFACAPHTPPATLERAYGMVEAGVIAYGHYHSGSGPDYHVRALGETLLVNVASVGRRHDGLCGLTRAEFQQDYWTIQQYQVPYDVDEEAALVADRDVPLASAFVR